MEKTNKKKLSKSAIVLIIGIVIIAIPCIIFATILISSALKSNSPVVGSRFEDDLATKITDTDINNVKSAVEGLSGVDAVTIDGITTGQLVVLVDVSDSYSEDQCKDIADQVYSKVIGVLPANTYFTATDNNKNYDLAIHVYNRASANDDYNSWSYVIVTKNSKMELPSTQIVSSPLDEELVKELNGEIVEEVPADDTNEVDGE